MRNTFDAAMNYVGRTDARACFHANDFSRDTVVVEPTSVTLRDARAFPVSLSEQGFQLFDCVSTVTDFLQIEDQSQAYLNEMCGWLQKIVGADEVVMTPGALLRFSERSERSGATNNSRPARFAHVDISEVTAQAFAQRSAPRPGWTRCVHFNMWRVITPPPQDVPLAFCDTRSVSVSDLIPADAIFDHFDQPQWSFEAITVAASHSHRWYWFSDMNRDEVVLFVTHDSSQPLGGCVPHCAFDHPDIPDSVPPRGSVEVRAAAYWY